MTGAPATSEPTKGGSFTAWNGYISGKHLVLEPGKRIVQTWRTTEFPNGAPDSTLEIRLSKAGKGARLALLQSDIPDGQSDQYAEGWVSHYFDPMTAYFRQAKKASPAKAKKNPKAAKKAGAKKTAKKTAKPSKKAAKAAEPSKAAKAAKPSKAAKAAKPSKEAAKAAKPSKKAAKAARPRR
jgi:hypothetical protein